MSARRLMVRTQHWPLAATQSIDPTHSPSSSASSIPPIPATPTLLRKTPAVLLATPLAARSGKARLAPAPTKPGPPEAPSSLGGSGVGGLGGVGEIGGVEGVGGVGGVGEV